MGTLARWSPAAANELESFLRGAGIRFEQLGGLDTERLRDRWRGIYIAIPMRSLDTTTVVAGWARDWEVFSRRRAGALVADRALDTYSTQRNRDYYILPDVSLEGMPAYRCSSHQLPIFIGDDLIVCPLDMSWTMSFTNLDGRTGGGPFFALAAAVGL
jgi:hypothetical protein